VGVTAAIATLEPAGVGTRGGQWKCSDVAIETALTLRLLFHLPLRQTEGFLHLLFGMMGIDLSAPDHTTLSRRGQYLDLTRDRVSTGRGVHLIVDSTGRSILGEGEWAAAKHGGIRLPSAGPRGERLLPVQVDHRHGLRARSRPGQATEAVLACNILNQMTQRGRPVSYAIGR
jgi:hypothetical protein